MQVRRTAALYTLASGAVMGQQTYERHLTEGIPRLLGADWRLRLEVVRPLRSTLPGTLRAPLLPGAPHMKLVRRVAGVYLTRRDASIHHRLDLRIPPLSTPEIVTVHDLAPWHFDDEGSLPLDARESLRRASVVVAPSQFSANELQDTFGLTNTRVIPNGVPDDLSTYPPLETGEMRSLGIDRPYILHAGGASNRKNLGALAAAWLREIERRTECLLVLCGPPDSRRMELFATSSRARLLSFVDRRVLVGLMKRASCVVVPSLYEGFGIPALEAMALGVPAVVARTSALEEVCADAAVMVPPTPEGLAEGLMHVLEGGDVDSVTQRGYARAGCYQWGRSLEAYAALYRELAS